MKIVIMAGGTGTRLWPLSRSKKPKQFFPILSDRPLLRDTYDRFAKDFAPADIYISTNPDFADMVAEVLDEVPAQNIIVEPEKRDTAPAMGFVAAVLAEKTPDEPIIFVPSDHYIANVPQFIKAVQTGGRLIAQTGKMLDIAVVPTFASTVLGYTRIGRHFGDYNGVVVYTFADHKEKPDYDTAKQYLEAGDYLWHASYYMWTPRKFMEAFAEYAPIMYHGLTAAAKAHLTGDADMVVKHYAGLEATSFDYAVTEHMAANDVLIIKGDFGWSDIGAWDVLYDQLGHEYDEHKNVLRGNCVAMDTHDSLVFAPEGKLVAAVGMNDVVIVDTGDALLVCPKGKAQNVKELVKQLKEKGLDKTFA